MSNFYILTVKCPVDDDGVKLVFFGWSTWYVVCRNNRAIVIKIREQVRILTMQCKHLHRMYRNLTSKPKTL